MKFRFLEAERREKHVTDQDNIEAQGKKLYQESKTFIGQKKPKSTPEFEKWCNNKSNLGMVYQTRKINIFESY